jgi:hypothetical protein
VPQLRVLGIWQVPLPSQVAGGVATLPLHEPDRQVVPATWRRQPPLPSHLPSRPQVDALSAVQARMGSSAPAGTGAQLPARPLTLQDWQLPQLAVSQQTPLVQKPLAHSLAAVQVRPSAFTLPHAPFTLHRFGAAQSAALVQVVRQALVVESQRYGAQAWGLRVTQIPLPSHWGARTSPRPSALQRGAPQVVPAACLRQAPAPSQTPSSPQVLGCVAVQRPRGSAMPAVTLLHTPAAPGRLQAWQVPQLADSQQTPSVQKPLAHSLPAVQATPPVRRPQLPPWQTLGGWQSSSRPQAVKQLAPLQR